MFFKQLPIFFIIFCNLFNSIVATNSVQTADGINLVKVGNVDLILNGKLAFTVPKECGSKEGIFTMCYATSVEQSKDAEGRCPPKNCIVSFQSDLSQHTGNLQIEKQYDKATVIFNVSGTDSCPLKSMNGRQTFKILELPGCSVTVLDAKLPHKETKTFATSTSTENPTEESKPDWVIPVVLSGVMMLVLFGVIVITIIYCWKCRRAEKPLLPVESPGHQKPDVVPKPPAPTATSPMTIPPVSPIATAPAVSPIATVPPKSPMTDAISPSVITPPQYDLSRAERAKKEKKPRPVTTTVTTISKSATKTSTAQEISPKFELALILHEHPFRNSRRIEGTIYHCDSGFDYRLEEVEAVYSTFPQRRIIADWEITFFLQITSDAVKEVPSLLKMARQELCQHGAVFDHRRLISFNQVTYRYIKRIDTPGFIAWYAFTCEYGRVVKITDDKDGDAAMKIMSVPSLCTLFFREDVEIEVRRAAYAHLRRAQTQLALMYPLRQLEGMTYPVCLIPALLKTNRRMFLEGADDLTYSTPLEMIRQIRRYRPSATEEGDTTDETQVSFSDGKRREILGSVKILGTELTPTTTVHEDFI